MAAQSVQDVALGNQVLWGTCIAAVVAVGPVAIWQWTRYATVYVHEVGHAIVAIASGRKLNSITLQPNAGGLTVTTGDSPSMVPTLMAGYPAPALAGLAITVALALGVPVTTLAWVLLVLSACILVMMRNVLGILVGLVILAGWAALLHYASEQVRWASVLFVIWFLLLSGIRHVAQQFRSNCGHGHDANALQRITHIPALVWLVFFFLLAAGATVLSIHLLLGL